MARRSKYKIGNFKYPAQDKIHNRISTLCRSIACTLSERRKCSEEDEKNWKNFFPNEICAYCGGEATHLDHLYALVKNRIPTGYGTEPANLVPCCDSCNSQKGNTNWKKYMKSNKCNHIDGDVQKRINNIKKFQKTMPAKKIELTDQIKDELKQIQDNLEKQLKEIEDEISSMKQKISSQKN